ncbi:TerB family tellurite resistance protein [Niastella sp. OAS944]|uniref:TerB family tellurite resistance protein n=1 Tax=Niastella sp. OAS944 TaxID=2664089 RepID=UPI003497A860|nr:hypothetical protein [Chitinophagaceae bacterium OAS944]
MKNWTVVVVIVSLLLMQSPRASAQQHEIQQLLLNVEKLAELKKILQNMYEGYRILEQGYNKVRDIANGNYKLHQVFLDGLLLVNPEVKKYYKVAEIIQFQLLLVKEYKAAFKSFTDCNMFTTNELQYISDVYNKLFKESTENLNALLMVVTAGQLRMSDDERLTAIDQLYDQMQTKLSFLRHFNKDNQVLALQRLKESGELNSVKRMYGIE